jgi:hypothetical protein
MEKVNEDVRAKFLSLMVQVERARQEFVRAESGGSGEQQCGARWMSLLHRAIRLAKTPKEVELMKAVTPDWVEPGRVEEKAGLLTSVFDRICWWLLPVRSEQQ